MRQLTKRQAAVRDFVVEYWRRHGTGPAYADISRRFRFKSREGARRHVVALLKAGAVVMRAGVARSLRPVTGAGRP